MSISLWQIETALVDYAEERERLVEELSQLVPVGYVPRMVDQEAKRENLNQQIAIIDAAIHKFIGDEIRKVDGIADYAVALDRLCHEPRERVVAGAKVVERCDIDVEIDRLRARRDLFRARLDRIKDAVKAVMEIMPWKPGKPKKLEGVRHSILLRGNGGAQPVEIHDESLIPAGLMNYTVTLPGDLWIAIERALGDRGPLLEMLTMRARVTKEPARGRIAEALAMACSKCDGSGKQVCAHVNASEDDLRCPDCDEEGYSGPCEACGGSGKEGVPGARFGERGSSVQIK